MSFARIAALATVALLAACEARIGKEDENPAAATPEAAKAPAEGKSEAGSLSIDAPGFDVKIAIPEGLANQGGASGDIIYPGSAVSGLHIQADGAAAQGKSRSGVELRFTHADPPEKIAAWYRDAARAEAFTVASAARDGEAFVISGTQKGDGDPFNVRLSPKNGGGTDARVTLSDRG